MTGTRIRRGGSSKLTTGKAQTRQGRGAGKGNRKKNGSFAQLLRARLPISERFMHRAMTGGIIAIVAVALWGVASFFGLPSMVHMELAELAARTGYEVKKVEVRGTDKMDDAPVYTIALGQVDRSMLNVDLSAVQHDIARLSWVKEARVFRRLPETLVVDIIERTPAAVWQYKGLLTLIDESGVVLEPVVPGKQPALPLLIGENANRQAPRFAQLMEAAPALKPTLLGATWVGNRRWDVQFQSGETLALPEGDELAAAALVDFARLDGTHRLLGRGIQRFDMRDPDKFVMRMPKGKTPPAIVDEHRDVTQQPPEPETPASAPQALASRDQG
ncbi:MAG: cell division protein FtsQ/DivIB [Sphingobium sp.]